MAAKTIIAVGTNHETRSLNLISTLLSKRCT